MARCRSPFKSLEFFVFCHGLLQLALLLVSGFMKGGIPTIERRYGFSSTESGLLSGFNEVGSLLLIIFVSFLGSRVHRPRFIGAGALICSLASLLVTLPHFLGDRYTYTDHVSSNSSGLCQTDSATVSPEGCTSQGSTAEQWIYPVLLVAQLLLGIGTVPIQPFGISYIDDFASKKSSPIYLGVLLAVSCFGPALGFLVGGFTLSYYVDFDILSPDEIHLDPRDQRFVGAWWLGFLGSAILLFITALPYMFFPREMPKKDGDEDDDPKTEKEQPAGPEQEQTLTQFLKSFPRIALRTFGSPVFLLVVFAQVCMTALVVGVATFMGKFIEKQFSLSFSFANMMIGGVVIPFAVLGILLGGGLMRKLNLSLTGAGKLCSAVVLLAVCTAIPLLMIGCPTQTVGGVFPHNDPMSCNADCACPKEAFNPVCGSDGVEFRSPCHAGCQSMEMDDMKVMNYTSCRCVEEGHPGHAMPGACGSDCTHLLPVFMALAAATCFLASTSQTPSFMMILRIVPPEDKSFAVGVQHFLWRVLAFLPGPVLYGSVIDTTCILWGERCGQRTSCLYYDMTNFRQRFLGVQLSFIIGGLIFFVLSMLVVRRQTREEDQDHYELKETQM